VRSCLPDRGCVSANGGVMFAIDTVTGTIGRRPSGARLYHRNSRFGEPERRKLDRNLVARLLFLAEASDPCSTVFTARSLSGVSLKQFVASKRMAGQPPRRTGLMPRALWPPGRLRSACSARWHPNTSPPPSAP
jgi:hypothetical protein